MRVLIAEDDADVRSVVCAILVDAGIVTVAVSGSQEASRLLKVGGWDVLLAELLFPGQLTGLDLANEAASLGIRCVIMSGAEDKRELVEAQGFCFLTNPFRMSGLLDAITADPAPSAI